MLARHLRQHIDRPMDFDNKEEVRNWVTALLHDHGCGMSLLEDRSGWNNQVFLNNTHVVRISSGRFQESFAHEVRTLALTGDEIVAPKIVAFGNIDDREWIISERSAGEPLAAAWSDMQEGERRAALRQLALALRALHNLLLPADYANPWIARALAEPVAGDLYLIEPIDYPVLYRCLAEAGRVPAPLLQACDQYIRRCLNLFDEDRTCLIHGDIHFSNLIWDGETLCVLDWELATTGAPDRDLQMLIEFVAEPDVVNTANVSNTLLKDDVAQVLVWLREDYPELFAHPELNERLTVYEVMRSLHKLNTYPADHSNAISQRLEKLLAGEKVMAL